MQKTFPVFELFFAGLLTVGVMVQGPVPDRTDASATPSTSLDEAEEDEIANLPDLPRPQTRAAGFRNGNAAQVNARTASVMRRMPLPDRDPAAAIATRTPAIAAHPIVDAPETSTSPDEPKSSFVEIPLVKMVKVSAPSPQPPSADQTRVTGSRPCCRPPCRPVRARRLFRR